MPSKRMADNEFLLEISAILEKEKGTAGGLYISIAYLENELSKRGVSFMKQDLVNAINTLINRKKVRLTLLCFENSTLGAELHYPAGFES